MRVYVSTVPQELEAHRRVACEVLAEAGDGVVLRDERRSRVRRPVEACARQIAQADVLLAIIGPLRGPVPTARDGGDDVRPWVGWEVRAAFEAGLPVVVLMSSPAWPQEEEDDEAFDALADLRQELARLAVAFEPPDADPELRDFREAVRRETDALREGVRQSHLSADRSRALSGSSLEVRPAEKIDWPERPFPVLLPYTHPDLLAGRERELEEILKLLDSQVPILGVYAASGVGKSSFLQAAVLRRLRAGGRAAAVDRHPTESGISNRLLRDMAVDAEDFQVDDEDPHAFVQRLIELRALTGRPPVLILDQFEDLLRRESEHRARTVIGALLAASVQRVAGLDGPPCRWILSYRQEFHGDVFLWLGDVLQSAHAAGMEIDETLPRDLSGPDRFRFWSLAPLGSPLGEIVSKTPEEQAEEVFLQAITKPLGIRDDSGKPRYPWRFSEDGAQRLAKAFGEARARRPMAPLTPEFQVVLAYLLDLAGEPLPGEEILVEVPDQPAELIDEALEDHLRRALDDTFPGGAGERARSSEIARARALLALRELADEEGRRATGVDAESLARAIGDEGRAVLEQLATPSTRLVVPERRDGSLIYVLSHDRLAEVLVRWVDGGRFAGLGIDRDLLALRRRVALESELYAAGEREQSTAISADRAAKIEQNREALIWGDLRTEWWEACLQRRKVETRRSVQRTLTAAVALILVALGAWLWSDRRTRRAELYAALAGEPEAAFRAADLLIEEWEEKPEALREVLRERDNPFDLFDSGLGGIADPSQRGKAVLRVAEVALPLLLEPPKVVHEADADDPAVAELSQAARLGPLLWALDFFAVPGPQVAELRDRALAPLREQFPPPPLPSSDDDAWIDVAAGDFRMGSGPGEGRDEDDKLDERPKHSVTLGAFRIGARETTIEEFRRLYPNWLLHRDVPARTPAASMSWAMAYTYAAWLGGRLPTEAEWEYAARAGCLAVRCGPDGDPAEADAVAWWVGNSVDPDVEGPVAHVGGLREPNAWGLYDVYGNVYEFCADWYGLYSPDSQINPMGPTRSEKDSRIARGGSSWSSAEWVVATNRGSLIQGVRSRAFGLRVVLPSDSGSPNAGSP